VLAQIFARAHDVRKDSRARQDAEKMALTIPVFRALAASAQRGQFHRSHAQLAYALKDQAAPTDDELREAEAAITRAIAIRDAQRDKGWRWYETNRAICRVRLDPDYRDGKPSSQPARDAIAADLRIVSDHPFPRQIIADDPDIQNWLKLNPDVKLAGP
jgi:hypothetical protein